MLTNKNRQEICEALKNHCGLEIMGRDATYSDNPSNEDWFDEVYLYVGFHNIQIKLDDEQLIGLISAVLDTDKESLGRLEAVHMSVWGEAVISTLKQKADVAKDDDT